MKLLTMLSLALLVIGCSDMAHVTTQSSNYYQTKLQAQKNLEQLDRDRERDDAQNRAAQLERERRQAEQDAEWQARERERQAAESAAVNALAAQFKSQIREQENHHTEVQTSVPTTAVEIAATSRNQEVKQLPWNNRDLNVSTNGNIQLAVNSTFR